MGNYYGYDYTTFGTGYASGTSENVQQRYTYTGRESTTNSSLMYYRYRMYGTNIGRFTARDPIYYRGNEFGNLYDYSSNSPVINSDPMGLEKKNCWTNYKFERLSSSDIWRMSPFGIATKYGGFIIWFRNIDVTITITHKWGGEECGDPQYKFKQYTLRKLMSLYFYLWGSRPSNDTEPPKVWYGGEVDIFDKEKCDCCGRDESAPSGNFFSVGSSY